MQWSQSLLDSYNSEQENISHENKDLMEQLSSFWKRNKAMSAMLMKNKSELGLALEFHKHTTG